MLIERLYNYNILSSVTIPLKGPFLPSERDGDARMDIEVAVNFSKKQGIIMQLNNDTFGGELLKFWL